MDQKGKFDKDSADSESRAASITVTRGGDKLKVAMSIGDINRGLLFKTRDVDLHANVALLPGMPRPSWRWSQDYIHKWDRVFGDNHSYLKWEGFCVDERDGSEIKWDQAEVAARNTEEGFDATNFGKQPWYRHFTDIVRVGCEWSKGGHDPDFHSGAKLWLGTYWWCFMFSSHA